MLESTLKPKRHGKGEQNDGDAVYKRGFFSACLMYIDPIADNILKDGYQVLKAAKLMNKKNKDPQILPPPIWLKMLGKVMKSKEGPASGCTP